MPNCLQKLRDSLLERGIIGQDFKLTRDYIFTSPSLAASIVTGRSANGRTEWKSNEHKSIKETEEL